MQRTERSAKATATQTLGEIGAADNPTLSELVNLGIDSTDHLTNLVNELLTFAKYDGENFSKSPVDFSVLAEDVVREIRAYHVMDDVDAEVEGELPVINGGPLQLRQVLLNHISNAFKYRSKKPLKVTISAKLRDDGWLISLRDNGVGISKRETREGKSWNRRRRVSFSSRIREVVDSNFGLSAFGDRRLPRNDSP